jgi:NAD(P)-dependent dehydrogenase (short-subunit alcohol dehydrogenase family)
LVTGAGRGIGAACARRLAAAGHRVAIVARSADQLEAVSGETGAFAHAADLARRGAAAGAVEAAAGAFGGLDAIALNAGVLAAGAFEQLPAERLEEAVAVNFLSVAEAIRAALPHLAEAPGRGRVVVVSSGAASNPVPGWSAYGATKAAVDQLVRVLAAELMTAGRRVTVCAFSPGMVDTAMQAEIRSLDDDAMPGGARGRFVAAHEGGRLRPVDAVGAELAALCVAPGMEAFHGEIVRGGDDRLAPLLAAV